MSVITNLLDNLASKRQALAEVQAKIDSLSPDLTAERQALETDCKALESEVKDKAKYIPDSQAHTLLGRLLQLVWTQPTPKWDDACLKALAAKHDIDWKEFETCGKVQPEGYWAIRKRGK